MRVEQTHFSVLQCNAADGLCAGVVLGEVELGDEEGAKVVDRHSA